jgi:hypothetical protein
MQEAEIGRVAAPGNFRPKKKKVGETPISMKSRHDSALLVIAMKVESIK